jgi:hypothetical protein
MGGVGKTQLALEYAYRYRTAYDVVAWLRADDENLSSSLHDLGEMLGLQSEQSGADHARAVVQELGRGKRRWLLVFDNADEPEAVYGYLPHGPGHVLITSRNMSWGEPGGPARSGPGSWPPPPIRRPPASAAVPAVRPRQSAA